MRTVSAVGGNVYNAVSAARKLLTDNKPLQARKLTEVSRAEHGDGLYRVVLNTGDVVEVTVKQHAKAEAQLIA